MSGKTLLQNLKRNPITSVSFNLLPTEPGIYIFWQKNTPIYIGKAINLKNRLKSYLSNVLLPKTRKMISESDGVSTVIVTSELEALLLESELIRKYQPVYNTLSKDDKHALYIQITSDYYPRVITVRKIALDDKKSKTFGPFPSGTSVKFVLKLIRRIFPYSDHKIASKPCLSSHIGLCSPCPNEIEVSPNKIILRKQYLKNISYITKLLNRKLSQVKELLNKEMLSLSSQQKYEGALIVRNQIKMLDYILQPIIPTEEFLQNPNLIEDIRTKEKESLIKFVSEFISLNKLERIECYDIAHTGGSYPTASMVTFIGGEPVKEYYRHFKVRSNKSSDDVAAMKEIISRRAKNFDTWGIPDLIIVDGGKPQVGAFYKELSKYKIPLVGLAKKEETLVFPVLNGNLLTFKEKKVTQVEALRLLQRIRNEAHRFARRYHFKLFKEGLIK